MTRRKDFLTASVAVAVITAVGALVVAAVLSAQNAGRNRLSQVQTGQVNQLARSMDTRISQAFTSFGGFVAVPYNATLNDPKDTARLQELQALSPKATTGVVLVDQKGVVVNGTLLRDRAVLGTTWTRLGLSGVLTGKAAILPVAPGLTTSLQTFALAYPLKTAAGKPNGAFVYEVEVSAASTFNQEVAQLAGTGHAEFAFVDQGGIVVASNQIQNIGKRLDEPLLGSRTGLLRGHGTVVVVEPVPAAGWRAVFRQPISNFEGSLTGPLHSALIYLALLTIAIAGLVTIIILRRLSRSREEQNRLRQISAEREEFISIVSHELRTPVAGLLGFLQTTLDHWEDMDDTSRRRAVSRAWANASRLYTLSRDVLDSSTLEAGKLAYSEEVFDVTDMLAITVMAAQELSPDHVITLDAPETPVWIKGDPERLQQVISNLLDNATKASPPEGPIAIAAHESDDTATITVLDTGPGLSTEDLERAFEKFVRGRGSRTVGSGLGLYICRQIIEAHRGTITATNASGGGAEFRIQLPMSPAPANPVGA